MCKRIFIIVLCCLMVAVLFTSCTRFETSAQSEYDKYYKELQKRQASAAEFLPESISEDCIEDMYLFYNGKDLIDDYYTIYLNCKYTAEEYFNEKNRISELFVDEDLLVKNSESFIYESLMYEDTFDYTDIKISDSYNLNLIDLELMHFKYVLFDESELRIVYVNFFDKELYGKSTNIPNEYLPKELVDLRNRSIFGRQWYGSLIT